MRYDDADPGVQAARAMGIFDPNAPQLAKETTFSAELPNGSPTLKAELRIELDGDLLVELNAHQLPQRLIGIVRAVVDKFAAQVLASQKGFRVPPPGWLQDEPRNHIPRLLTFGEPWAAADVERLATLSGSTARWAEAAEEGPLQEAEKLLDAAIVEAHRAGIEVQRLRRLAALHHEARREERRRAALSVEPDPDPAYTQYQQVCAEFRETVERDEKIKISGRSTEIQIMGMHLRPALPPPEDVPDRGQGEQLYYERMGLTDPGNLPDSPAVRALMATVRDRVQAALAGGRRVNVLEVGRREAELLDCKGVAVVVEDRQLVKLALRPIDAEAALSVYYDGGEG